MPVISTTQEAEAGESLEPEAKVEVSQDHTIELQPGRESKTLSPTPNKKKKTVGLFLTFFHTQASNPVLWALTSKYICHAIILITSMGTNLI